jgi:hypothetical protein
VTGHLGHRDNPPPYTLATLLLLVQHYRFLPLLAGMSRWNAAVWLLAAQAQQAAGACPTGAFKVGSGGSGAHFPSSVGRLFYGNDMCGGAPSAGPVQISKTVTGKLVSGGAGGSKVGGLSGGGAGCARRLEMLSWPAGSENYTITTIATSSSTVGGAADYIGGPALDLKRGLVYYIRTDSSASERVLERYNYVTGTKQEIYRSAPSTFPAPSGSTYAATFQIAINVDTQVLYWFCREDLFKGWVHSLDVSQWTPSAKLTASNVQKAVRIDETPTIGGATVMTDWFSMAIDCSGALYFAFYKKISKVTRLMLVLIPSILRYLCSLSADRMHHVCSPVGAWPKQLRGRRTEIVPGRSLALQGHERRTLLSGAQHGDRRCFGPLVLRVLGGKWLLAEIGSSFC